MKEQIQKKIREKLNEGKEKKEYVISFKNEYGFTKYIAKSSSASVSVSDIKNAKKYTKQEADDFINDPLGTDKDKYVIIKI